MFFMRFHIEHQIVQDHIQDPTLPKLVELSFLQSNLVYNCIYTPTHIELSNFS